MISVEEFINYIKSGEVPPAPPHGSSLGGWELDDTLYSRRQEVTDRGMWAIVDKIWTKELAKWIGDKTCLEVMAGAGWLAKALSEYGIDIIATDSGQWDNRNNKKITIVHDVEKLEGLEAVKKYHDRDILIVSWPPYDDEFICHICEHWDKIKPIIYIGENNGGCNAPEEFWNHFTTINSQPHIPLMAWSGIHDRVSMGYYQFPNNQKEKKP